MLDDAMPCRWEFARVAANEGGKRRRQVRLKTKKGLVRGPVGVL